MELVSKVFESAENLISGACRKVSSRLPNQLFCTELEPYLHRFYIFRRSMLSWDFAKYLPSIYLHYFHRGDQDTALHNHPWGYSASLVLTNGYLEDRWDPHNKVVIKRELKPGSINVIRANDFHRVDLRDPSKGAWTLFVSGPRVQDWSFWEPGKDEKPIPWREFVATRDGNVR
jgi:hypothetical protein